MTLLGQSRVGVETFKMTLKAQLNLYLKERGLTASELARKSGVSKQVISIWLGGSKPKNVEQVKKVADALGITVDNLLFGIGAESENKRKADMEALFGDDWISGVFEIKFRRIRK